MPPPPPPPVWLVYLRLATFRQTIMTREDKHMNQQSAMSDSVNIINICYEYMHIYTMCTLYTYMVLRDDKTSWTKYFFANHQ